MEVLERYGTQEQKDRWLKPLLNGEIRSAYGMTEPNLASSDAKQIGTRAELIGDEWVINGEKYYISGAEGQTMQDHDLHGQNQSQCGTPSATIADFGAVGHAWCKHHRTHDCVWS